uniref:Uncharacterized protein n=1 Tax=Tanacetum cinerariifolium TaxID=118510 RepID=A0A6L2JJB4_TANCI|nr:hypothetical protein [Tanacetum cinerariifolium]
MQYKTLRKWTLQVLCHSAATPDFPKSVICNVQGVTPKFLEIEERMSVVKEDVEQKLFKGVEHSFNHSEDGKSILRDLQESNDDADVENGYDVTATSSKSLGTLRVKTRNVLVFCSYTCFCMGLFVLHSYSSSFVFGVSKT